MKILFVIPSLAKGGQEKAGMLLTNFLLLHHDVTAVCFENKTAYDYDYKCKVIRIKSPAQANIVFKFFHGLSRITQLKKIKKDLMPTVSIAFGNTAIITNYLAAGKEKKISSIRQSLSSTESVASFALKIHRHLYKKALKSSDAIVPVSNFINGELKRFFNITNKDFINNGYDFAEIDKMAAEPETFFFSSEKVLIHSGRVDLSKGHWHLIKIFIALKQQLPETKLILLGSTDTSSLINSSIREFCVNMLEHHNLKWTENENEQADVLFAGHQINPFRFIAHSNMFLLTSMWEGFPNALVEAMACKVPVIAADCTTGPAEILIGPTNEAYGILMPALKKGFDKENTKIEPVHIAWAQKINDVLCSSSLTEYYKEQSLKRSTHYSIEAMGQKWLNLLNDVSRRS